jgi:hypothetical protein
MPPPAAGQFAALTQLLEQARLLDNNPVDHTMGVIGSVEHCRAQLRDITQTLGRVASLAGSTSVGWCRTPRC